MGLAHLVHLKLHLLQMFPGPVNRLLLDFTNLNNEQIVKVPQLTRDRPYPVVKARRVTGQYGSTILLTLTSEGDVRLKVYLPKRYADLFDDVDIEEINLGRKHYKLVYIGMARQAYLLKLIL